VVKFGGNRARAVGDYSLKKAERNCSKQYSYYRKGGLDIIDNDNDNDTGNNKTR